MRGFFRKILAFSLLSLCTYQAQSQSPDFEVAGKLFAEKNHNLEKTRAAAQAYLALVGKESSSLQENEFAIKMYVRSILYESLLTANENIQRHQELFAQCKAGLELHKNYLRTLPENGEGKFAIYNQWLAECELQNFYLFARRPAAGRRPEEEYKRAIEMETVVKYSDSEVSAESRKVPYKRGASFLAHERHQFLWFGGTISGISSGFWVPRYRSLSGYDIETTKGEQINYLKNSLNNSFVGYAGLHPHRDTSLYSGEYEFLLNYYIQADWNLRPTSDSDERLSAKEAILSWLHSIACSDTGWVVPTYEGETLEWIKWLEHLKVNASE